MNLFPALLLAVFCSAASPDSIKETATFISDVPADNARLWQWHDEVQRKLAALGLTETQAQQLVRSQLALAAAVKGFRPETPELSRAAVVASARELTAALAGTFVDAGLGDVEASLAASPNADLRAAAKDLDALRPKLSGLGGEEGGRRLAEIFDRMKNSGAEPGVTARFSRVLTAGGAAAPGKTPGLVVKDVPLWAPPTARSEESMRGWLYGGAAVTAGVWAADAVGLSGAARSLERYAYQARRRDARDRLDEIERDLERDPASPLAEYRRLLAAKPPDEKAIAEYRRGHQAIIQYEAARSALTGLDDAAKSEGLDRDPKYQPSLPGGALARDLTERLTGVKDVAAVDDAELKAVEDRFIEQFVERPIYYEASMNVSRLRMRKDKPAGFDGRLDRLEGLARLAERADALADPAQCETAVRAVGAKLALDEPRVESAVRARLKRIAEQARLSGKDDDPAVARAQFRLAELRLSRYLATPLDSFQSAEGLKAVYDGLLASRSLWERLERDEPERFYAVIGRYNLANRELNAHAAKAGFDSLSLRADFPELDRFMTERARAAGPADTPKLAFIAAFGQWPGASLVAREKLAGLRQDFVLQEALDRSDALVAGLEPDRRQELERQRAEAARETDPALRRRALRAYLASARGALESSLPYSEGPALRQELDARQAELKRTIEDLTRRKDESPVLRETLAALEARARAGQAPPDADALASLLAEARARHPDDPVMKALAEALTAHQEGLADWARRSADFQARHPEYAALMDAVDRHDQALFEYAASGQAPDGTMLELPVGRVVVGSFAAADGAGWEAQNYSGTSSGYPEWPHVPRLVHGMVLDRHGPVRGLTVRRADGVEEFRAFDGRLVVLTRREQSGKVFQEFVVDGLPAGSASYDPNAANRWRVVSTLPGLKGVQEAIGFPDKELQVRTDDLAGKTREERAALVRERVREIGEYTRRLRRESDARWGGDDDRPKPPEAMGETQERLLSSMLMIGLGNRPTRLKLTQDGDQWRALFIQENEARSLRLRGGELEVDAARVDGQGRPVDGHKEVFSLGDGGEVNVRRMLARYVERDGVFTTDWGYQPVTSRYSVDGLGNQTHLGDRNGVFVKDQTVDGALVSGAKATGSGVVGFGETIWYGAVGTGKLALGGGIGLVDEDWGRRYAAEGFSYIGEAPLAQAVHGKDVKERMYDAFNRQTRDIIAGSDLAASYGGDGRAAFMKAHDTAGALYRWGGETDGWARAAYYAAGTFIDFGHGTTATLPMMFAGQFAAGLGRSMFLSEKAVEGLAGYTQMAVNGYFMVETGKALLQLPDQYRKLDWSKPETAREFNAGMANAVMLLAALKAGHDPAMKIDATKPFGLNTDAWTQFFGEKPVVPPLATVRVRPLTTEQRLAVAETDLAKTKTFLSAAADAQRAGWEAMLKDNGLQPADMPLEKYLDGLRKSLSARQQNVTRLQDEVRVNAERERLWRDKTSDPKNHRTREEIAAAAEAAGEGNVRGAPDYGSTRLQTGMDCVIQTLYNWVKPFMGGMEYYDLLNLIRWKLGDSEIGVGYGTPTDKFVGFVESLTGGKASRVRVAHEAELAALGNRVNFGIIQVGEGSSHMIAIDGAIKGPNGWEIYVRDSSAPSAAGKKIVYTPKELIAMGLELISIDFNAPKVRENLARLSQEYQAARKPGFEAIASDQQLADAFAESQAEAAAAAPAAKRRGTVTGTPAEILARMDGGEVRRLTLQNRSAQQLAEKFGWDVEQHGRAPGPDYTINGKTPYECYSPEGGEQAVLDGLDDKVNTDHNRNVVLNLSDAQVKTGHMVRTIIEANFRDLDNLVVIRGDKVWHVIKNGKVDPRFSVWR